MSSVIQLKQTSSSSTATVSWGPGLRVDAATWGLSRDVPYDFVVSGNIQAAASAFVSEGQILRPLGDSGVWYWVLDGVGVRGISGVLGRVLDVGAMWVAGDVLPDYYMLGLGGASIRCELVSGSGPLVPVSGTAYVDILTGELVSSPGLVPETLFYGSEELLETIVLDSSGAGRVWVGSLRPGLDLLLSDCSRRDVPLVCKKVLRDADLPVLILGLDEFYLSLESGKLVCHPDMGGRVLRVLGVGSYGNPVPLAQSVALSSLGVGHVSMGDSLTNWPYDMAGLGSVGDFAGEVFIRGKRERLVLVDYDSDLPDLSESYRLGRDAAYLSLESGELRVRGGSGVDSCDFVWGCVPVGVRSPDVGGCILVGLRRGPYILTGGDFVYARDGVLVTLTLPVGRFTAEALALILGLGWSSVAGGLVLSGSLRLEIGVGGDLLGFASGWVSTHASAWNPYNGLILGLYRQAGEGDLTIRSYREVSDELLVERIGPSPFVYLGRAFPDSAYPGYSASGYFKITSGSNGQVSGPLDGRGQCSHWGAGLLLDCDTQDKFAWIEHVATGPVSLDAATDAVVLSTGALVPGSLTFRLQEPGSGLWSVPDYVVQGNSVILTEPIAPVLLSGGVGVCVSGVFSDVTVPDLSLAGASCVLVTSAGDVYEIVNQVGLGELTLVPAVNFGPVGWEILEAFPGDVFDPGLVSDQQFVSVPTWDGGHVPFAIRVVTPLGLIPVADLSRPGLSKSLRYGSAGSSDRPLNLLVRGVVLDGVIASSMLLPAFALTDVHYQMSLPGQVYFSLRVVGAVVQVVTVFTVGGPPAGVIEVGVFGGAISGQVRVAADLVSDLEGLVVLYDQQFLLAALITEAEGDVLTGALNIPVLFAGQELFLSERYESPDVILNPISGALNFPSPVKAGQYVEAQYYSTNTAGLEKTSDLITEFLSVPVRLETATRLSPRRYTFNPTNLAYDTRMEPMIWVGVEQQNYSGEIVATVDGPAGLIHFAYDVDPAEVVQITYAVLNCPNGRGLQAYSVTAPPVWQPPFWLSAGQSVFVLEGDRTGVVYPGCVVLVGGVFAASVLAVTLLPGGGTQVEIDPAPVGEVGSRAPGRDPGLLISSGPLTTGFMLGVPNYCLGAGVGVTQVRFFGDLTQFARARHLLELDGTLFLISGSSLSDDGRYTLVNIAAPAQRDLAGGLSVRISARPIYLPEPSKFNLPAPVVPGTDVTLIRFPAGSGLPGRVLAANSQYVVDGNGSIQFQEPILTGLLPGERLFASYTKSRIVTPVVIDDAVVSPKYSADYLAVTQPSVANGLLGGALRGKFFLYDPEIFTVSIQELTDYLPVVQLDAARRPENPEDTATPLVFPQGTTGLTGVHGSNARNEAWDALNLDAGARVFVTLFNDVIVPFEQVLETIDGRLIGDRDGKLKFHVGTDAVYPEPGGIFEVTSHLSPRIVWGDIMSAWSDTTGWTFQTSDLIYDPRTISASGINPGQPVGSTPTSDVLDDFIAMQRQYQRNDIDDVLMTGFKRTSHGGLLGLFPVIEFKGKFQPAWQPSSLSRLYPEQAHYFTRLLPGLDADIDPTTNEILDAGFYSAGRLALVPGPLPGVPQLDLAKTRNKVIGQIANPVLGEIENISDTTANDRGPRARVWAYYPNGDAALDAALGVTTVGAATLVLTPQLIQDFVLDPITGLPDISQLVTNGGGNPDCNSGDPGIASPGFRAGEQILLGNPNGTLRTVNGPPLGLGFGYAAVCVKDIQAGCVIRLETLSISPLTGAQITMSDPDTGGLLTFAPNQGDTVYTPTSQAAIDPSNVSDPVTLTDAAKLVRANGDYRIQSDLKVRSKTGALVDASLPVFEDIWSLPIQDWLGQNPPKPGTCIEGIVNFNNTSQNPAELPALFGGTQDDSGDNQIPFLATGNTEIRLLQQATRLFDGLFTDDFIGTQAAYPDEIAIADGVVYGAVTGGVYEPGVLYTSSDLAPTWTPGSGVGPARPYDLLFVQTGQSPTGITGIQTIGAVGTNAVEPPRFVTMTNRGDTHKYTARNLFGYVAPGAGVFGLLFTENLTLGIYTVTFDFFVSSVVLDDGSDTGSGGIAAILANTGNVMRLDFYSQGASVPFVDTYQGSLTIPSALAGGTAYFCDKTGAITPVVMTSPVSFIDSKHFAIASGTSFQTVMGLLPSTTYDFTVTIDTYVDTATVSYTAGPALIVGSGAGTQTASINPDRLTFDERVSFASAKPRGTTPRNGDPAYDLSFQLDVHESPVGSVAAVSSVNGPFSVNLGAPLTFVSRSYGVGTFTPASSPGAGDELGSVRAMAWEGAGNVPITGTALIASVAASCDSNETSGPILSGTGDMPDPAAPYATEHLTWIENISSVAGGFSNVEPGDVVVVDSGDVAGTGAVKAGSYLVRHVVAPNAGAIRLIATTSVAGSKSALDLRFPPIRSFDLAGNSLVAGAVPPVKYSPTGCGFPTSGLIYVLRKTVWTTWSGGVYTIDPESVYALAYSAVVYDATAKTATFTLTGAGFDAVGTALTPDQLEAGVRVGQQLSGMTYFAIGQLAPDLPDNNLVGLGGLGVAGVVFLTAGNQQVSGAPVAFQSWNTGSIPALVEDLTGAGPGAPGEVAVMVPSPSDSQGFYSDRQTIIYGRVAPSPVQGVAAHLDMTLVTWDNVHFTGAVPANILYCLLPGDEIAFAMDLTLAVPGFAAIGGLFLEPSFPMPTSDLGSGSPHVVTASNSTSAVGIRKYGDFVAGGTQETVGFTVRRIRRFHDVQTRLANVIDPLRFVYETRRGVVAAPIVTPTTSVTFPSGTNLGFFDDPNVGCLSPGATLRVLDAEGNLLDQAEIRTATSPTTLLLREPGLTADLAAAAIFEVYLATPLVPHEQSCAQLLTQLTNPVGGGSVLFRRSVDYSSYPFGAGGIVASPNEITDPDLADITVVAGDYVLVDPAGSLYTPGERGARPLGDAAVIGRAAYIAGGPGALDDNRGFYRVVSQTGDTLTVLGASKFCGAEPTGGDDVLYGSAGAEYVVLPTIHASTTPEGAIEGQQTLRITAAATGTGSFNARVGVDATRSIGPFSYQVIRPAAKVFSSQESIETALFMRERMLTWIEVMRACYGRGGDYYVFQRGDFIADLPSPTDEFLGAGVFTNAIILGLQGMVDYAPFSNDHDCLSVLDRRLWINDTALDFESPTGVAPFYAGLADNSLGQRPVLPDAIADVLSSVDDLYGARYAWIAYRTNQSTGSSVVARRALTRIAQVERDQRNAIRRSR